MGRSKMQKCRQCRAYGLRTTCEKCGGPAQAAAPLKFSPQDPHAALRRKYERVNSPEWVEALPTPKQEAKK